MQSQWKETEVGFIGGGNMAKAIGFGLIEKGWLTPSKTWVSARTPDTLASWKSLGVNTTLNNCEVVLKTRVVFLAVKPHMLDEVIDNLRRLIICPLADQLFISILVGVSMESLYKKLVGIVSRPRIIRSMPNTPMMVGAGITVYCTMNTTHEDDVSVNALFSCLGLSESVAESLMNPIGGLSGSGPAYAYLIIEALADGAVKMGVPRLLATKLASQVLVGAGKMVLKTGKHPGQLKDEVCSPGGTTITGVHALENGQVRASMMNAVVAAGNKSHEMAQSLSNDN